MLSVAAAVGTPWSSAAFQHVAPHPELLVFLPGHLAASLLLSGVFFCLTGLPQPNTAPEQGNPGSQVCTNPETAPKVRQDALCAEESR